MVTIVDAALACAVVICLNLVAGRADVGDIDRVLGIGIGIAIGGVVGGVAVVVFCCLNRLSIFSLSAAIISAIEAIKKEDLSIEIDIALLGDSPASGALYCWNFSSMVVIKIG